MSCIDIHKACRSSSSLFGHSSPLFALLGMINNLIGTVRSWRENELPSFSPFSRIFLSSRVNTDTAMCFNLGNDANGGWQTCPLRCKLAWRTNLRSLRSEVIYLIGGYCLNMRFCARLFVLIRMDISKSRNTACWVFFCFFFIKYISEPFFSCVSLLQRIISTLPRYGLRWLI